MGEHYFELLAIPGRWRSFQSPEHESTGDAFGLHISVSPSTRVAKAESFSAKELGTWLVRSTLDEETVTSRCLQGFLLTD